MLSSKQNVALASALSGLAGFVDGIGFLHLGGLFVSFMSGNSTRLGVSIAEMDWRAAFEAVGLIVVFVAGAGCGSAIMLGGGEKRRPWLLLTEAVLLAIAALCASFGLQGVAVGLLAFAMGLENSVFQLQGGAGLGLTYVTGALVKIGQLIAAALNGGPRWEWFPNLMLWASLVIGSVAGAVAYRHIGLNAVWFGAAAALLLSAVAVIMQRQTAA